MKLKEIDGNTECNQLYIEKWKLFFGNPKIDRCINCGRLFKKDDLIMYVLCSNGKVLAWHDKLDGDRRKCSQKFIDDIPDSDTLTLEEWYKRSRG